MVSDEKRSVKRAYPLDPLQTLSGTDLAAGLTGILAKLVGELEAEPTAPIPEVAPRPQDQQKAIVSPAQAGPSAAQVAVAMTAPAPKPGAFAPGKKFSGARNPIAKGEPPEFAQGKNPASKAAGFQKKVVAKADKAG